MGSRQVEWMYATFGNPEKTSFLVRGCGLLARDPKQRRGQSVFSVVGEIARRLGSDALEGAVIGELEGMGWVELLGLVAARLEGGRGAIDSHDEVNKRFMSRGTTEAPGRCADDGRGDSTPAESARSKICVAPGN